MIDQDIPFIAFVEPYEIVEDEVYFRHCWSNWHETSYDEIQQKNYDFHWRKQ